MGSVRDTALAARHSGDARPSCGMEKRCEHRGQRQERYEAGSRPTVVVEGTDGTVAVTAFASDDDIASYQAHNADEEQS